METQHPSRLTIPMVFAVLDNAGVNGNEIAQTLGVSAALVSLWRLGKRKPSSQHFAALLRLAFSLATSLRAAYRATTGQLPTPAHDAQFKILVHDAEGFLAKVVPYVRESVARLSTAITNPPTTWDYEHLTAVTTELSELLQALRIIAKEESIREERPDENA